MNNSISRQDAIDELQERLDCARYVDSEYVDSVKADVVEYTIKALREKTSAEPERKKGKWIKVDPHLVICPFCKHASSQKNFCAECGADMRGEQK